MMGKVDRVEEAGSFVPMKWIPLPDKTIWVSGLIEGPNKGQDDFASEL